MLEVVWMTYLSEISFAKLRRRSVTAWDHIFSDHIFSDNIFSDCYTVDGFIQVIQVWAYYAMPELGANYGSPDLDEMFSEWDEDVEDPAADNIIKVMFNDHGWKKESSIPQKKARKGSFVSAEAPLAGSDGFGMTKEQIERAFKDISDAISDGFGTCLREIKLLGDRMRAVEKKVEITKKGSSSDDFQLTTTSNPPKPVHEPVCEFHVCFVSSVNLIFASESVNGAKAGQNEAKGPSVTTEPSSSMELCLVKPADDLPSDEPSVIILDKQVSTASDLLLEEARRQTKKETAMVNLREKSERERKLAPT
ncbi:hypothetical protein DY000_02049434 [Brassica cretica]|uniref:DUF1985 domain-containing protein n=1 Tax=Brassica cretica TaxID=69181 RepID=A0ABQ7F7C4_BRACR|nr:hypothetical protein DY000_02049434 [Brassica cretica]